MGKFCVPFLFSNNKHDKRGFLFKTRARFFNAPGNHVMIVSFITFLNHISANEGNLVMQDDDKDQLSGDDTILDHIEKVNKGKRQKI